MANLSLFFFFTRNTGVPATGLTLADIDLYLTRHNRTTGVDETVWDGSVPPLQELNNMGAYSRIYFNADLGIYDYAARATYTGVVALDVDNVTGATGVFTPPVGTPIEFTYTVTDAGTGLPVEGVEVWVTTDVAGANIVWKGDTDTFGVARDDDQNLPWLDPGTYYFWSQKAGYTPTVQPDIEVVS